MKPHSRTTFLGYLTIIGAVLHAVTDLFAGKSPDLAAVAGGITAGVGLIKAADASDTVSKTDVKND